MSGQREQHTEEPAEGPARDDQKPDPSAPSRPPGTEMDQPAEGGDMPGTEGADRASDP